MHIGSYSDEKAAALAYDAECRKLKAAKGKGSRKLKAAVCNFAGPNETQAKPHGQGSKRRRTAKPPPALAGPTPAPVAVLAATVAAAPPSTDAPGVYVADQSETK